MHAPLIGRQVRIALDDAREDRGGIGRVRRRLYGRPGGPGAGTGHEDRQHCGRDARNPGAIARARGRFGVQRQSEDAVEAVEREGVAQGRRAGLDGDCAADFAQPAQTADHRCDQGTRQRLTLKGDDQARCGRFCADENIDRRIEAGAGVFVVNG